MWQKAGWEMVRASFLYVLEGHSLTSLRITRLAAYLKIFADLDHKSENESRDDGGRGLNCDGDNQGEPLCDGHL